MTVEQQTIDIFMIVISYRTDYQFNHIELYSNWFEAWMRLFQSLDEHGLLYEFSERYDMVDDRRLVKQNYIEVNNCDYSLTFESYSIPI